MIRRAICWLFHSGVMYAGSGSHYECRRCGLRWPVPWR